MMTTHKRPRQIYIDYSLWNESLEEATRRGISLSKLIRDLLRSELNKANSKESN